MSNIDGTWYNELGSKMVLKTDGQGGLGGTYESAVGDAKGENALSGRYDDKSEYPTLGWAVQWNRENKHVSAITAWSGQLIDIDGILQIESLWLLTEHTDAKNEWNSTIINQGVFTRTKPSPEEITKMQKLRKAKPESSN